MRVLCVPNVLNGDGRGVQLLRTHTCNSEAAKDEVMRKHTQLQ